MYNVCTCVCFTNIQHVKGREGQREGGRQGGREGDGGARERFLSDSSVLGRERGGREGASVGARARAREEAILFVNTDTSIKNPGQIHRH